MSCYFFMLTNFLGRINSYASVLMHCHLQHPNSSNFHRVSTQQWRQCLHSTQFFRRNVWLSMLGSLPYHLPFLVRLHLHCLPDILKIKRSDLNDNLNLLVQIEVTSFDAILQNSQLLFAWNKFTWMDIAFRGLSIAVSLLRISAP